VGHEITDIRLLSASDFDPLLAAESRAWSEQLRWDYSSAARIILSCLAEQRLSGYALVNAGRVEGYGFYVCEGDKGLVGDLFVRDCDGLQDQTLVLLRHLVETLLATPGITRVEAQLPHFDALQLEPCLRTYGFKAYLRRFMALPLNSISGNSEPSEDAGLKHFAAAGLVPAVWERRHDHESAQLIYQTYRGHVDATINDQYASAPGAARLIENIMELHGCGEPIPRASLVALHTPTQRLTGLIALTAVTRRTAHIPQIAVVPAFQCRGLGSALLQRALRSAREQNFDEVSLTVTDLNQGAVQFYERLGFETFRTFGAFVWQRSHGST
jgi:GNAT superfamily N-acetyltransferase